MDAGDAFDLAFGGEPFVKSFASKGASLLRPWRQSLTPALDAILLRFSVLRREISADTDQRFEGDRFGDHVIGVAPRLAPNLRGRFEKIPQHAIVTFRTSFVRAAGLDFVPGVFHPPAGSTTCSTRSPT